MRSWMLVCIFQKFQPSFPLISYSVLAEQISRSWVGLFTSYRLSVLVLEESISGASYQSPFQLPSKNSPDAIRPHKILTHSQLAGSGPFGDSSASFDGSLMMPSADTIWDKESDLLYQNTHFENFATIIV
ncbi:hypothetical protein Tco_0791387 [Tanacetum coccineum]